MATQNYILINDIFIEKLNKKMNMNLLKDKVKVNMNDFLKKIKMNLKNNNELEKILKEEILYMREQCRWQEMINFILVIFSCCFLFMDIIIIKIAVMRFKKCILLL